jgi:hypothetical protein
MWSLIKDTPPVAVLRTSGCHVFCGSCIYHKYRLRDFLGKDEEKTLELYLLGIYIVGSTGVGLVAGYNTTSV